MATLESIAATLDSLASFDAGPFPVVSLYLNLQANQHGRDQFEPFVRKELAQRTRGYPASGPERESLERDVERIREYLSGIDPSAEGLALFACSAGDLFEAIPLAAPIDEHRLFISDQPHVYPLARLLDQYPRYAVVVADTHHARLFVVALNAIASTTDVEGTKTRRHKMGGWSQARYQRHMENYHLQHAKEVVEALARVVRDERIESVILAGDEVIVPLLREQLPDDLQARIVDVLKLDIRAPERDILEAASEAIRSNDARTDAQRVEELLGAYRAGGLAVVGIEDARKALELGQVDELIITAQPAAISASGDATSDQASAEGSAERSAEERIADELTAKAQQTSAGIRVIEDASLLADVGGVGATLRFTLEPGRQS
jgi:peptide chain release factor subunit 1